MRVAKIGAKVESYAKTQEKKWNALRQGRKRHSPLPPDGMRARGYESGRPDLSVRLLPVAGGAKKNQSKVITLPEPAML
ncbi:MAG TPA: hypothetical protein PLI34_02000, partial [Saprospiraceae bacterium]|nr:hypothetical protein [Saprospiraceae bacterium]